MAGVPNFTNFYPYFAINQIGFDEDVDQESVNERLKQIDSRLTEFTENLYTVLKNSPEYIKEFFKYSTDPFYFRTYNIASQNLHKYTDFFDTDGNNNQFMNQLLFSFPDVAIEDVNRYNGVLFYKQPGDAESKKVPESAYKFSAKYSGLRVFIDPTKVSFQDGTDLYLVIFRNASDYGPYNITSYDLDTNGQTLVSFPVTINPLTTWAPEYLQIFRKFLNTNQYVLLDRDYVSECVENGLGNIEARISRLNGNAVEHGTFIVMNTLEPFNFNCYFKLNTNGTINTSTGAETGLLFNSYTHSKTNFDTMNANNRYSYMIPLINKVVSGVTYPTPFKSSKDFYVYINDLKLIPEEDYDIRSSSEFGTYIQIKKQFADANTGVNIRVMKGLPVIDPKHYYHITSFDSYANATVSKITSLLTNNTAMCFSNRHFKLTSDMEYIIDGLTNFDNLVYRDIEIMSTYFVTSAVKTFIDLYCSEASDYEKFLDFLNQTDREQMIANFIANKGYTPVTLLNPTTYTGSTLPTVTSITKPSWFIEDVASTMTVTASGATRYKWVYEGGAPLTLSGTDTATLTVTPTNSTTLRYAFVRVYVYNSIGLPTSELIQLNIMVVNKEPKVNLITIPSSIVKGQTFSIDIRTAVDDDGTVYGFNAFVNNGATITNKTQYTCTVNTAGCTIGQTVHLSLEVFDTEYNATFLSGLPYAGLGDSLYVGTPNNVSSEDGFAILEKDILITA